MDQFLVLFFKLLHLGGIILPGIENFPGVGQKLFLPVGYQVRMKLATLALKSAVNVLLDFFM